MEWNRGPKIGQGASATVSTATSSVTHETFAVKSAQLSRSSFLQREKEILSQLSSPYIVQYRGDQITYENNTQLYNLFMEYVPGGSISDSIKKNGGSLDESVIRIFTHQILLGLDYLHANGIVHCDIKGQNLLIGKDGVKIADFGCAKRVTATPPISGTPAYMAPEVARGEEQSFPADLWALGCTVVEMVTGSHPFASEESPVSVLYQVGFSGQGPEIPMYISSKCQDFIKKCLEQDPRKRATTKELLQHPFLDKTESNSSNIFDQLIRVTPTSILDQGIWDSVSTAHISSEPGDLSERISGLVGILDSEVPNWDSDEDWINVRINENEEMISESVEIESDVESQEFDSLVFESVDTIEEDRYFVSSSIDCFSILGVTLVLSKNVSDYSTCVSLYFQTNLVEKQIVQYLCQFKCVNNYKENASLTY